MGLSNSMGFCSCVRALADRQDSRGNRQLQWRADDSRLGDAWIQPATVACAWASCGEGACARELSLLGNLTGWGCYSSETAPQTGEMQGIKVALAAAPVGRGALAIAAHVPNHRTYRLAGGT